MQRAVALIYPDQCAVCSNLVDEHGGLCAACWRSTHFVTGLTCDTCALPLLGEGDGPETCDECRTSPRPWSHCRAALYYSDVGRRIVLSLKYGDRTDLARPSAAWIARAAADILREDTTLVPIPAHWARLLKRRYNPAVEIARALGTSTGCSVLFDGLTRHRSTKPQEGLGFDARFENLQKAFKVNARHGDEIRERSVCIVDDTFTSGATLSSATEALLAAGAKSVSVVVLARTVKSS